MMFSRALSGAVATLVVLMALVIISSGAVSIWYGAQGSVVAGMFNLFRVTTPLEMVVLGSALLAFGIVVLFVLGIFVRKGILKLRDDK